MVAQKTYHGRNQRTETHLYAAQQGGRASRMIAERGQGKRGGIRERETLATEENKYEKDRTEEFQPSEQGAGEKQDTGDGLAKQRDLDDLLAFVSLQQKAVHLARSDQPQRDEREDPAILFFAYLK